MKPLIKKCRHFIDQLPTNAKTMMLAAVIGLIFVIWYYSFWESSQIPVESASEKIKQIEQSIPELTKQLEVTKAKAEEAAKESTKKGKVQTSGIVLTPTQTSQALHDLISASNNITLLKLTKTPPKEVTVGKQKTKFFEYEIAIKFLADYFSAMEYLRTIEKLKWEIFWDKLEYKVLQYPNAEVTLYLHTVNRYGGA